MRGCSGHPARPLFRVEAPEAPILVGVARRDGRRGFFMIRRCGDISQGWKPQREQNQRDPHPPHSFDRLRVRPTMVGRPEKTAT